MNRDSDEYQKVLAFAMKAVANLPMTHVAVLASIAYADQLVVEAPEKAEEIIGKEEVKH